MKDLIKRILKEGLLDERLKSDIQFIIDEGLVDIEVYPDLTYVNVSEMVDIFPGNSYADLIGIVQSLGYGKVFTEGDYKKYTNPIGEAHNINGPALIYGNNLEWAVEDKLIATHGPNKGLKVLIQPLWDKYFADSYKP